MQRIIKKLIGKEGEKKFEMKLRSRGLPYIPLCRFGTPDFIVFRQGTVYLVEVKTSRGSVVRLPLHQLKQLHEFARVLRKVGLRTRCVVACYFKGSSGWRYIDVTDADEDGDLVLDPVTLPTGCEEVSI